MEGWLRANLALAILERGNGMETKGKGSGMQTSSLCASFPKAASSRNKALC